MLQIETDSATIRELRAELNEPLPSAAVESEENMSDLFRQLQEERQKRSDLEGTILKLHDEMDSLRKLKESPKAFLDKAQWQSRRTQKLEKVELRAMQQERDREVQAKLELEKLFNHTVSEKDAAMAELKAERAQTIAHLEAEVARLTEEVGQLQSSRGSIGALGSPSAIKTYVTTASPGDSPARPASSHGGSSANIKVPVSATLDDELAAANASRPTSTSTAANSVAGGPRDKEHGTPTALSGRVTPVTEKADIQHRFDIITLSSAFKCQFCTGLLRGLERQGLSCKVCGYVCHASCASQLNNGHECCPIPESARNLNVEPMRVRRLLLSCSHPHVCTHII
jgi:serine/threonine-protein kinase MRCK